MGVARLSRVVLAATAIMAMALLASAPAAFAADSPGSVRITNSHAV